MSEPVTPFPFDTLEDWDDPPEAQDSTRTSPEFARALLAWLLKDRTYRHTVRARAIALRYVVDARSMGNPTMKEAARMAGVARCRFNVYVIELEKFFQINSRPNKFHKPTRTYTAHPTPCP
jgi:hypothetical protein